MVLLNGKYVEPTDIDPAKHRYLGMFRPAVNPLDGHGAAYVLCLCGTTLKFVHELREHYLRGCCDVQQYADIELKDQQ